MPYKGSKCKIAISIHAPCEGSDLNLLIFLTKILYFNPRSLCRERPVIVDYIYFSLLFQSTLPVKGATSFVQLFTAFYKHFNPRSL